jgi:hypothetical protein
LEADILDGVGSRISPRAWPGQQEGVGYELCRQGAVVALSLRWPGRPVLLAPWRTRTMRHLPDPPVSSLDYDRLDDYVTTSGFGLSTVIWTIRNGGSSGCSAFSSGSATL